MLELLEQLVKLPVARHWREKSDARIDFNQLAESIEKPGEYPILVCAHCAVDGYPNCGDILLNEFRITHEGEFITWEIDPPGHEIFYEYHDPLHFKFHRPQYKATIQRAIKLRAY